MLSKERAEAAVKEEFPDAFVLDRDGEMWVDARWEGDPPKRAHLAAPIKTGGAYAYAMVGYDPENPRATDETVEDEFRRAARDLKTDVERLTGL